MLSRTGCNEMRQANLFDKRRNLALANLYDRLLSKTNESFSAAVRHDGRQAASRLFSAEEITPVEMISGHVKATVDRVRFDSLQDQFVLILQDTTTFNYTKLKKTTGLGPIGDKTTKAKGLHSHGALAVTEDGTPLGVVDIAIWARETAVTTENSNEKTKDKNHQTIDQKESKKWLECVRRVQPHFPLDQKLLFVQDREADIFDLFLEPRRSGAELLVRAAQPRKVEIVSNDPNSANSESSLFVAAHSSESLGEMIVHVTAKPNREARDAVVAIRSCAVVLKAPRDRRVDQDRTPQNVWLISVQEVDPPVGAEALDWTLICTFPAPTFEEACRMVKFYTIRWLIERLHFTLKSGLEAENLHLDDAHSIKNALALYYMVSWRLLHLTYLARNDPDQPAENSLDELEVRVLSQIEKKPIETISMAILAIAKLGGYRPYRKSPPPGLKALWLGIRRLEAMIAGYKLAMA